jgi:hypothetical protein
MSRPDPALICVGMNMAPVAEVISRGVNNGLIAGEYQQGNNNGAGQNNKPFSACDTEVHLRNIQGIFPPDK